MLNSILYLFVHVGGDRDLQSSQVGVSNNAYGDVMTKANI